MTRIVLFDWHAGGHHERYVRRFAEALAGPYEVVVAVPDPAAAVLEADGLTAAPLGAPRPVDRPGADDAALARAELDLLAGVVAQQRPDHVVHMYVDPVLRHLVRRPSFAASVTAFMFFPRAHYPRTYGTALPVRERLRGVFHEHLLRRFRSRPDAHRLLALDAAAVERWNRRAGAPACWIPEPPVSSVPARDAARPRDGIVLYGALAPRKGLDLLAEAVVVAGAPVRVVIAGSVEPGYEGTLRALGERMATAGARVELHARTHGEAEGLRRLQEAEAVVLPYPAHYGMSRVLVEAATVGTPVIAHDHGLVADLVRRHGLGVVVDCRDPHALGGALRAMTGAGRSGAWERALAAFAAAHSHREFEARVRAAFDDRPAGATAGAAARPEPPTENEEQA